MKKIILLFLLLFTCSTILYGCAKVEWHGLKLEPEQLDKIVINKTSKQELIKIIGNPSTTSVFDNEQDFIYYNEQVKILPMRLPLLQKRTLWLFNFNKESILTKVTIKSLEDGNSISFDKNKTTDIGSDASIWKQMLQNFGRF